MIGYVIKYKDSKYVTRTGEHSKIVHDALMFDKEMNSRQFVEMIYPHDSDYKVVQIRIIEGSLWE